MKRKQCTFASLLLLMVVAAIACGNKSNASGTEENKDKTESVNVPAFNADSAYPNWNSSVPKSTTSMPTSWPMTTPF